MLQDIDLEWIKGYIQSASGKLLLPGMILASHQYAPSSQTTLVMTGTTGPAASLAAWDTNNIFTGPFTAPPSGSVLVEVGFSAKSSVAAAVCVVGLCAHGSVTPVVGVTAAIQLPANSVAALMHRQIVSGLTPGTSYNFDFMGAMYTNADTFTLVAYATTNNPSLGSAGGPVVLTVKAL